MMALAWDPRRGGGDLALSASGGLLDDGGLATSVLLSLFCDRRAEADDVVEDDGLLAARGWVGDALTLPGQDAGQDRIGSRLWLLARAKQTDETLRLAEDYAREALAWLTEDGLAADVVVAADWIARGAMRLAVTVTPTAGVAASFEYGLRTS